jgi:predicted ATPase/transcriptional regulator with XRE-family HTH domain
MLRAFRLAAGLSQEALAERTGLSARGISDLERGIHQAPYQQTLAQLLDGLGLDEEQRAALTAAARRPARTGGRPAGRDGAGAHHLPEEATSFLGRAGELATVTSLLRRPDVRMVTLTGPGGSGKTRLAVRAAGRLLDDFADGVCLVSLAALTDPQVVPSAVAAALGLRETEGHSPAEAVLDHLRPRDLLLVLDNFEQLTDAAWLLTELLEHCPRLRLLVTSRAVLHLSWEFVLEVPPLRVPDLSRGGDQDYAALARYEGVALFVERALAADATFAVTGENARAIAEICSRLDGLPLAIELAAARLRVLPPAALLERLSSRLTLLVGGAKDRPTRQQTLRAAIDWSYSLLDEHEQRLFARLGVFAAGCTVAAAEAVCPVAGDLSAGVLDGVASLVDKSLLRRREHGSDRLPAGPSEPGADPEPHLGMLETIREYALERLAASDEEPVIREQHAAYYLSVAEQAADR